MSGARELICPKDSNWDMLGMKFNFPLIFIDLVGDSAGY